MDLAQMFNHRFGARAHLELLINMADMRVDGRVTYPHGISDFFVEIAFGEEFNDLGFAGRKGLGRVIALPVLLEGLNNFPRNVAVHGGATIIDIPDGHEEFGGPGLF